jgi:hypothetical protein
MDKMGIGIPNTLDDYRNMLVTFKDNGVEIPTTIASTGYVSHFMAPFNLPTTSWYQVDNKVHYGPIEDSFLEYLTLMHDWYSQGLIDKDFYTATGFNSKSFDTAYTLTGRIAMWSTTYQTIHSNMTTAALSGDTKYDLVATPFPTPTLTPTRVPVYVLKKTSPVCDPSLGEPLIQVMVRDREGLGVPGVEAQVTWTGGQDSFYTGLKPQVGVGYADFSMARGMTYTLQLVGASDPVENLAASVCPAPTGALSPEDFAGSVLVEFTQR